MSDLDPRFAVDLSHRILDSCNSTVSERPVFGHAFQLPVYTCKMQSLHSLSVWGGMAAFPLKPFSGDA